jgi:hypothetical protein
MQAPEPWAFIQACKAMLGRTADKRWRGMPLDFLRKPWLLIRLDEHGGKVSSTASLAGGHKLFAAVTSHACHIVTLSLALPARRTGARRTKRRAYRCNQQRQHNQEGKHARVRPTAPNWNRFVHPYLPTLRCRSLPVNSHFIWCYSTFSKSRSSRS